jgi:hypothetical protein
MTCGSLSVILPPKNVEEAVRLIIGEHFLIQGWERGKQEFGGCHSFVSTAQFEHLQSPCLILHLVKSLMI